MSPIVGFIKAAPSVPPGPPTGPWRVSGSTLVGSDPAFLTGYVTNTFFIKPDGSKLFTLRDSDRKVRRYDLNPVWDISTASYDGATFDGDLSAFMPNFASHHLWFSPSGLKMYAMDFTPLPAGPDTTLRIYEFNLSISWNPSTRSFVGSFLISNIDSDLSIGSGGMVMTSGLTELYIGDSNSDRVLEFTFGTPGSVATLSYTGKKFNRGAGIGGVHSGLFLKDDGTRLFSSDGGKIYEYDMTTAYDLTTASYNTFFYDAFTNDGVAPTRHFWKSDGTRYYVLRDDGRFNQYDT